MTPEACAEKTTPAVSGIASYFMLDAAMAPMFGWSDVPEADDDLRARHAEAEAETNRRIAPAYAALDESERDELVALCEAALASVR